eukprot:scaffold598126_cov15-Prasinocladus_malaysianus.AAC.1
MQGRLRTDVADRFAARTVWRHNGNLCQTDDKSRWHACLQNGSSPCRKGGLAFCLRMMYGIRPIQAQCNAQTLFASGAMKNAFSQQAEMGYGV